jgi:hypothetical protein
MHSAKENRTTEMSTVKTLRPGAGRHARPYTQGFAVRLATAMLAVAGALFGIMP